MSVESPDLKSQSEVNRSLAERKSSGVGSTTSVQVGKYSFSFNAIRSAVRGVS